MRKLRLAAVILSLAAGIALAAFLLAHEARLRKQHAQGFPASGNSASTDLSSQTVLAVGNLYLTFDSTGHDSALWLVHPEEMFLSFDVKPLVQWKDAGRLVWSGTGRTSADLLIEFAPAGNHRIAVVRATCNDRTCQTVAQERGLPATVKLFVSDDGSALLVSDTTLTVYSSIADLMLDSRARVSPRFSSPEPHELAAQSRDSTLLLTRPELLSGEIIEGTAHERIELAIDVHGSAVAVALRDGVQLVIDDRDSTQLWDCPSSVLQGSAECTVYKAPSSFPRLVPVSMSDDECGIALARGGWIWLVRRNAKTQELFPGDGIVQCGATETAIYLARHIGFVMPKREGISAERHLMQVRRSK